MRRSSANTAFGAKVMKVIHNAESDTLIIALSDKREARRELIAPDLVAQFDEDDDVIAIEILGASRRGMEPGNFEETAHLLRSPTNAKRLLDALRRSEEHTSELQSPTNLVCRLLL